MTLRAAASEPRAIWRLAWPQADPLHKSKAMLVNRPTFESCDRIRLELSVQIWNWRAATAADNEGVSGGGRSPPR